MKKRTLGMTLTAFGMLAGAMLVEGTLATPAFAQVNINVNIGPPPPVIVHTRPTMVFLPEPALYVAVGVPYDIYFISGRYYYMHGGNWFWGSGYDGPWVHVVHKSLPPGLQKYKVVQLHDFREREYRVYKTQGPSFKGKHFDAEPGPGSKSAKGNSNDQGQNGPGNSGGGKSNGRGKGK
jgi:hypothetical protein